MRILVTGGGGFIGSFVCERLVKNNHDVFALDMADGEKIAGLKDHANFHYVQDSILNKSVVQSLVKGVDIVFHFAAVADPRRYVQEPLNVLEINVNGTLNVLSAASEVGAKFIFASTSEIYGKNPNVPWKEDGDRLLGSTHINRWCYSSSKAICEHYIQAYHQDRNLSFLIYRFFNIYGPRVDDLGFGRVIPIFLQKCFKGEPIPVHGDGRQTRTFTYVEDAVDAVCKAAFAPACENEILNVGSGREVCILDLARMLVSVGNFQSEIEFIPATDLYGKSFEDIPRRIPCVDKIKDLIDWEASTSLEDGLAHTIDYFRNKLSV